MYFKGHIANLGPVPQELLRALNQRLESVVQADPEIWERSDRTKPNDWQAFEGNTEHIVMRFVKKFGSHLESEYLPAWEAFSTAVQPVIDHLTPFYGYEQGAVNRIMFAKLKPGAKIGPHVDGDLSSLIPHKIHVPLLTNNRTQYVAEEINFYHLQYGRAYEVNNQIVHGGQNLGPTERIHLIFDYYNTNGPQGNSRAMELSGSRLCGQGSTF